MSVDNVEPLIERLMAVYGEPKTSDPKMFLNEYRRALSFYGSEVLDRTGDQVIDSSVFWPKPSEVREIAARVAASMVPRVHVPEPQRQFDWVGPEDERYIRALAEARVDNPAYARMLEARGKLKVEKLADGPMKRQTAAAITDLTKRMTGERD